MRAAIFDEPGGPEVVRVAEVETPEPGPGEVRIEVKAASMNHLDLWVRRGVTGGTELPHIGGADMAGIVESVGPGAEDVPLGTRVVVDPSLHYDAYEEAGPGQALPRPRFRILGEHARGGFAEFAVVPAANLVEVPDGFGFEKAAAGALVGVTAWRGLMHRGGLRAGERVLVTGASGGVGSMAVQVAALAGARVYALTSGAENVRRVRELGADVAYDRLEVDFAEELWRDTGKRGVNLILDSVGAALWGPCLRSLAMMGRLVTYGATSGGSGETEIHRVFWKQLSILGSTMGSPAQFRELMALVLAGRLEPVIDEVIPLDEIRRAHERLEEGDVFGKLVIVP